MKTELATVEPTTQFLVSPTFAGLKCQPGEYKYANVLNKTYIRGNIYADVHQVVFTKVHDDSPKLAIVTVYSPFTKEEASVVIGECLSKGYTQLPEIESVIDRTRRMCRRALQEQAAALA